MHDKYVLRGYFATKIEVFYENIGLSRNYFARKTTLFTIFTYLCTRKARNEVTTNTNSKSNKQL